MAACKTPKSCQAAPKKNSRFTERRSSRARFPPELRGRTAYPPGEYPIMLCHHRCGGRKGGVGKSTIARQPGRESSPPWVTPSPLGCRPQHSLAAWAAQGTGVLAACVQAVKHATPMNSKPHARRAEGRRHRSHRHPSRMPETTGRPAAGRSGAAAVRAFASRYLCPQDSLSLALHARAARRSKKPEFA